MAASGRWFVTPHAVRRYITRVHPWMTYEQALSAIIKDSMRAHFVRADHGSELWRGPKPHRVRYRIASREAGLPQLITVLPIQFHD